MDALLAFWPGLQVLSGDLKPAVQTHEMLYQVMQMHTFIPEAFTFDFQVSLSIGGREGLFVGNLIGFYFRSIGANIIYGPNLLSPLIFCTKLPVIITIYK